MISGEFAGRVEGLIAERRPFVLATVVRALRPTSVRPGDAAIVLPDGTIDGFVGGVCATSSVRLHSLRALETGEPLLLRLVPGDDQSGGDGGDEDGGPAGTIDGGVVERNPCLSGGSLEIFLEPHLPAIRLVVIGDSPIAHALKRVGQAAGYECETSVSGRADGGRAVEGAAAVVVASHGSGEEAALAAALSAGVPYVALVASAKRGAAVRAELEVPEELRARLHTPAGLEIGAVSPDEIAISILAELVAEQHSSPVDARPEVVEAVPLAVREAVDPVCGMRVAVTDATPQLLVGAESLYFCCEGCRDRYAQEHAEAVVAR
ncbi:MAG: XdhC family protein [Solirubrobacteraceae bacterium]